MMSVELKQSDTEISSMFGAIESDNESFRSHISLSIIEIIKNATCLADLWSIIIALNPLQQLKQLLLDEVNKIMNNSKRYKKIENGKQSNDYNSKSRSRSRSTSRISLNELYFKIYPMDEILSDNVICSIIPYLSGSNMYNKLPIINKHFNFIMKNHPLLFENYIISLPLQIPINKSLFVCISHKLNRIQLSDDVLLKSAIGKHDKYAIHFNLIKIEDMNKYCPFMWDQINKWHFIINNQQKQINIIDDRWRELLYSLISQSSPYITSIKIEPKTESEETDNIDLSLLCNLNKLKHINFPSNKFIASFSNYNNECNQILQNILYLDLIRVNDTGIKILSILKKILVLKIQFDDDSMSMSMSTKTNSNNNLIFKSKQYIIQFPESIEFIIIDGLHFFGSEHILNFQNLSNIVAVSFKNSTFEQWMTSFSEDVDNDIIKETINNHILWPINNNNIQCVLLDEVSNDFEGVWWRYFKSFNYTANKDNNNCPKIKYLRYTSSPRLATDVYVKNINEQKTKYTEIRPKSHSVACQTSPVLRLNKSRKINRKKQNQLNKPQQQIMLVTNPTISADTDIEITDDEDDDNNNNNNNNKISNGDDHDKMDEDNRSETPYFGGKQRKGSSASMNSTYSNNHIFIPTPADTKQNNPYHTLAPKAYTFPLFKSSLISINRIGQYNDRNMLILSDENNDGVLWKLLIYNKFKYINNDEMINNKIGIYQKWFSQNICKCVYHFGANTNNTNDNISPLPISDEISKSNQSSVHNLYLENHPFDLEHLFETYFPGDQ